MYTDSFERRRPTSGCWRRCGRAAGSTLTYISAHSELKPVERSEQRLIRLLLLTTPRLHSLFHNLQSVHRGGDKVDMSHSQVQTDSRVRGGYSVERDGLQWIQWGSVPSFTHAHPQRRGSFQGGAGGAGVLCGSPTLWMDGWLDGWRTEPSGGQ